MAHGSPADRHRHVSQVTSGIQHRSPLDPLRHHVIAGRMAQEARRITGAHGMSVFVTGSESFIGKALFAACKAAGVEITGVDAGAPGTAASKKADIRDSSLGDLI